MALIGLNVIYGLDTDFSAQAPASDAKVRYIDTRDITSLIPNPDGSGGSIIMYDNNISPYAIEVRVTQTPNQIAASDIY